MALAWLVVLGLLTAAAAAVLWQTVFPPLPPGAVSIDLPPATEPPVEAPEPVRPEPVQTAEPEPPAPEPEPEAADNGEEAPTPAPTAAALPAAPEVAAAPIADQRPHIAIVITGLGLSRAATEMALERLPPAVTLSFSPYAKEIAGWISRARARGHEVLIDLPMEPASFPNDDPGPRALMTDLEAAQNLERLRWILARGQGYVGVAAIMGSRFTASESDLRPILEELKQRGILFLDNRSSERSAATRLAEKLALPLVVSDRALDDRQPNRAAIEARLVQIERLALTHGFSIAMGRPYPATLEQVARWAGEADARGFVLAPVTAVVGRQRSG